VLRSTRRTTTMIDTKAMAARPHQVWHPKFDANRLDPRIGKAVVKFRSLKLVTFTSCQGGEDHCFKVPTIGIYMKHERLDEMRALLEANGFTGLNFRLKTSKNKYFIKESRTDGQFAYVEGDCLLDC
jgi:hypothetical protein